MKKLELSRRKSNQVYKKIKKIKRKTKIIKEKTKIIKKRFKSCPNKSETSWNYQEKNKPLQKKIRVKTKIIKNQIKSRQWENFKKKPKNIEVDNQSCREIFFKKERYRQTLYGSLCITPWTIPNKRLFFHPKKKRLRQ